MSTLFLGLILNTEENTLKKYYRILILIGQQVQHKDDIKKTGFMATPYDSDAAVILILALGADVADVETEDSDEGQALVEVFDRDLKNSL